MTRRAPPSPPAAPPADDPSSTPSSAPALPAAPDTPDADDSLDVGTLTRVLTPIAGPEMKETMLTYGQKMELELKAKIRKELKQEAQSDLLLRMLTKRFGSLPADVVARVQQADTLELEQWADRILDATTLEDMFAEQHG